LRRKEFPPVDLTQALAAANRSGATAGSSFTALTSDLALNQARLADQELRSARGPLHGVIIGLKDLYATKSI
jgi:Asp-tRNA(Asn)/Glu-tRNA(Gln) amidotransferase A subunit family amidase